MKRTTTRTIQKTKLSVQMKKRTESNVPKKRKKYEGSTDIMISTGSTLLDLAISGGRVHGGGIPGGILVEIFGPTGAGKTVLLCEIAGAIQRQGGSIMFHDPEARLNKLFARIFDLDTDDIEYTTPDTIPEVFSAVRKWEPPNLKKINGCCADSLAALSTNLEMDNEEGDKMGMRRAKEFSEELRKTARILVQKNMLMVCSNQIRESGESYGPKYKSPGGQAIGFYSSLRLRANQPEKIWEKTRIAGKEIKRVVGVKTEIEVFKSSVWKPFRSAPVYILFDYGIDDIRANLQFIKDFTKNTTYTVNGDNLGVSLDGAVLSIEKTEREEELKEATIDLWEEIESKFDSVRKPKKR